jgi:hypothetical protein
MAKRKTFFISRAGTDEAWVDLIAGVVESAGHEAIHQAKFQLGRSIPVNISEAIERSDCTIAILSPAYFASVDCRAELGMVLRRDPTGELGRVFPVLIAACDLPSYVGLLNYLNLAADGAEVASERLRAALTQFVASDERTPAQEVAARPWAVRQDRVRQRTIERIRHKCNKLTREKDLFEEIRIQLQLGERSGAVIDRLEMLVHHPVRGVQRLRQGKTIIDVYYDMDQSLLIQGEPGSGKTFLLFELLDRLLTRASCEPSHPIPAVFDLSDWAKDDTRLQDWLADQLNSSYNIPPATARKWVEENQILPLLDGLDWLNKERRVGCVKAVNAFRRQCGLLPLVVTSRTTEYDELPTRLEGLGGTVLVQPLTRSQVEWYLSKLESAGATIRGWLDSDPDLWELLDTPLMLSVLVLAYVDSPNRPPLVGGTIEQRREHLWTTYVDRMLQGRIAQSAPGTSLQGAKPRRRDERHYDSTYTPGETVRWLQWLAGQMIKRGRNVFYIERLQPDWLADRQRTWFGPGVRLVSGLGVGVTVGILNGLFFGPSEGLRYGAVACLGGALVGPTIDKLGLGKSNHGPSEEIVCAEAKTWSPADAWRVIRARRVRRVAFGMVVGLVAGLFKGVQVGLQPGHHSGVLWGAMFAILFFVIGSAFHGLLDLIQRGIQYKEIALDSKPNQGIHASLKNAWVWGCEYALAGLIVGLSIGLLMSYIAELQYDARLGPAAGLALGLLGWFRHGGSAAVKHFVVRGLLAWNGDVPLRYARFLEFACKRILLCRESNQFQFIHQLLMVHFASRDNAASDFPLRPHQE